MKPRILFVDHAAVLSGAELSLLDIARHFKETSRVMLLEDGPFVARLEQNGVAVEVLPAPESVTRVSRSGSLLHDLQAVPGVLKLVWELSKQAHSFDVIYANSQKAMVIGALAGKVAGIPVIWHLRDLMTTEHFSPLHCRIVALLTRLFVTRVIANSDATREAFIASGGHADQVVTVHNGIRPDDFEAVSNEDVQQLRKELGTGSKPVIGAFSRLAPWKGQHVLLQALQDVPEAHALLVGDALFNGEAQYARRLRELAQQQDIEHRVHFLGFRDDIPRLMKLCDVVVHTSTAPEPFGRVIVEGLLARRPVVGTRAGGATEIIDDGKTGVLIPPGDPEQLAHALNRLLSHPDEAQALAEAGYRMARSRFSIEDMLDGISHNTRQVLTRSKPSVASN